MLNMFKSNWNNKKNKHYDYIIKEEEDIFKCNSYI